MSDFRFTVTLITNTITGQDADGNDIYTPVPTSVPGCTYVPAGSVIQLQGQTTVIDTDQLYLPTGTVITDAVDKVTIPGYGTYLADGLAVWPPHPTTGRQPARSVVLRIRKATG